MPPFNTSQALPALGHLSLPEVANIYRIIFNASMEAFPRPPPICIGQQNFNLADDEDSSDRMPVVVYTVRIFVPQNQPRILTPPEVAKAWRKSYFCDFASCLVKGAMQRNLANSGWSLDCISVTPRPRILLAYPNFESRITQHTVLKISSQTEDQWYVMDLTLEQFGYDEEQWLCDGGKYLELFTTDGSYEVLTDEWKRGMEELMAVSRPGNRYLKEVGMATGAMDWDQLVLMDRATREDYVRESSCEKFAEIASRLFLKS